jgi:hypothetical protein
MRIGTTGRLMAAFIVSSLFLAASASAAVIWNEAIQGDLSDDRFSPTAFDLTLGTSSILGTVEAGDRDFVTISVPAGLELSQLILADYDGIDGIAFIGVVTGEQFTVNPDLPVISDLLGYALFGTSIAPLGTDYLPEMGLAFGTIGFTPPLESGSYSFWIQQTGTLSSYQWDFVVTPEPASLALLLLAGATFARRSRS